MIMLDKQLSRYARQCERIDAEHWRLAMANGRPLNMAARFDDGFLLLDADAGVQATRGNLASLVSRSGELPATLKLAAQHGCPNLRLRAEFPLTEEIQISADRIRQYLEGAQAGMHQLHDGTPCETSGPATTGSLAELLQEAGWPYRRRPGGELLSDLETGNHFHQAEIEGYGEGACFRVTLFRGQAADDVAQEAICFYLLEANAAVRYARAFLRREDPEISAGFEVRTETLPSAAEAGHALSALTVASRQCARELEVLGGGVASTYRSARPPFYHSKGA